MGVLTSQSRTKIEGILQISLSARAGDGLAFRIHEAGRLAQAAEAFQHYNIVIYVIIESISCVPSLRDKRRAQMQCL